MKKALLIPLLSLPLISCVQKEQVKALNQQILDIRQEIASIKEKQKENSQNIEQLATRIDNLSKTVTKNTLEIQKLKLAYTPPKNPPLEGAEKVLTPQNPEDVYNKALDLYYQGKYKEAEKLFKKFLSTYKDNKLYDNALFWLGQIYYSKNNFKEAAKQFKKLVDMCEAGQLKDCNKEPMAMLKLSYSLLELGKKEEAKKVLQNLIEKFPDREEAILAEKKLESLND